MSGEPQQDLTRREVLKRAGGGAAAAMSGVGLSQTNATSAGEPVALQYFHEGWTTITADMDRVADWGFDAVWLMQPAKGAVTKEEQNGRNDPPLGYQPINLRNFDSELGTEGELTTLIDTAHQEGVDVYLDTVLNHMAAEPVSEFPYFSSWDFHNEGGIPNWAYDFDPNDGRCFENGSPKDPDKIECDPWWVENGDLLGLRDFKQEKDYVRGELKRYMEDMAALGADGYRFDAAKHIPESFFANYANQWADDMDMFRVGEIITGSDQYLDGYVTAGPGMHVFDYPLHFTINSVFGSSDGSGDMHQLQGAGYVSQNPFRAMPFVENHDTTGPSQYDLAHAFALTIEGYPVLYNINPDWLLDYEPIKNMVWVKKNLAGGQTLWRHTDSDLAIYERQSNLLVGLNNSGTSRSKWVETSWADTELNDYAGNKGNVTTESDGRVEITVPAEGWVFYAPVSQDLAVDATGDTGVQSGGEATISISAQQVDQLVVEDLWTDWTLSSESPDGGSVTSSIDSAGTVTIDYGSIQTDVSPSITVSLPERYVGGTYGLTVTASNADGDSAESTATISMG